MRAFPVADAIREHEGFETVVPVTGSWDAVPAQSASSVLHTKWSALAPFRPTRRESMWEPWQPRRATRTPRDPRLISD